MSPVHYLQTHWRSLLIRWGAAFAGALALMLVGGETALAAAPAALLVSAIFVLATADGD